MSEPLPTIDRILSSEPSVEPSAHFTRSVMEAVQNQSTSSAFAFPWKRFALGCIGALLLGVLASVVVALKPFSGGGGLPLTLLALSVALLLSFASLRLSEALVT